MSDALQTAFGRAQEARDAIESIIESVRSGVIDLSAAFERADTEPLEGRCFAVKVFEVVPDVGKVRARRTMEDIGLDEAIWLRDVPTEQRAAIISELE